MTWHRLADHPLPEPREGQVLLLQIAPTRHPETYICTSRYGERLLKRWLGSIGPYPLGDLRDQYLQDWPDAQWFLVPAPGEQSECTGFAAVWCPVHGDCTCRARCLETLSTEKLFDDPNCPLHGDASDHAAPGEQSEADDLVQRAVRNAGRREATLRPRWSWLTEVFGVGSTRAHELCRRFGLDPDEMVGGAGDDS